jgi:hypothetical protein
MNIENLEEVFQIVSKFQLFSWIRTLTSGFSTNYMNLDEDHGTEYVRKLTQLHNEKSHSD